MALQDFKRVQVRPLILGILIHCEDWFIGRFAYNQLYPQRYVPSLHLRRYLYRCKHPEVYNTNGLYRFQNSGRSPVFHARSPIPVFSCDLLLFYDCIRLTLYGWQLLRGHPWKTFAKFWQFFTTSIPLVRKNTEIIALVFQKSFLCRVLLAPGSCAPDLYPSNW